MDLFFPIYLIINKKQLEERKRFQNALTVLKLRMYSFYLFMY